MARTATIPPSVQAIEDGTYFVEDETPVGSINGSNTSFTLAGSPNPVGSLEVRVNGQVQVLTTDYTLTGDALEMAVAWPTGALIRVDYHLKP